MRFKYMLIKEDGKFECQMTGLPEIVVPSQTVMDCDPNSTYIH